MKKYKQHRYAKRNFDTEGCRIREERFRAASHQRRLPVVLAPKRKRMSGKEKLRRRSEEIAASIFLGCWWYGYPPRRTLRLMGLFDAMPAGEVTNEPT